MAGGTQVTQTTTEPWLQQQQYLERGFGRAEDLYSGGAFAPSVYGAPGTMDPSLQALQGTPAMPAPGLAGFDPQQQAAMQGMYGYAMGARPAAMQSAAEQALLGGEGVPGFLPYSQAAMGIGLGSAGFGGGPTGYAGVLPFEGDQYAQMLRGDVDYEGGPYSAMADVYRQQAEDQMQQALGNVRQGQVLYQPGGGSRGDIFAAQAAATGQKALAQNLAGLYGGAYQQAMAGRMPAAQMGIGAQQFGMGYGLQGMQGAQAGAGMYPSLMQAPLGMYGAAQQVGEQQRALQQAIINRDIGRYEYQQALPQQALQSYLAGVTGDYGGMSQARGPGGTGAAETLIAALAGKAIGL
jgi:hypothetical protein